MICHAGDGSVLSMRLGKETSPLSRFAFTTKPLSNRTLQKTHSHGGKHGDRAGVCSCVMEILIARVVTVCW